jgi:hypothetical protein
VEILGLKRRRQVLMEVLVVMAITVVEVVEELDFQVLEELVYYSTVKLDKPLMEEAELDFQVGLVVVARVLLI